MQSVLSTLRNSSCSFQNIPEIPDDLKQLYKTVWEISQKTILKMAADRGAFIDQSQSLNIHIAEPNYGKLTSMHFYGWKQVRAGGFCPTDGALAGAGGLFLTNGGSTWDWGSSFPTAGAVSLAHRD